MDDYRHYQQAELICLHKSVEINMDMIRTETMVCSGMQQSNPEIIQRNSSPYSLLVL